MKGDVFEKPPRQLSRHNADLRQLPRRFFNNVVFFNVGTGETGLLIREGRIEGNINRDKFVRKNALTKNVKKD